MEDKSKSESKYKKLRAQNIERLKELAVLNKISKILKAGNPFSECLRQIVLILPEAYQNPDDIVVLIFYDNQEYCSPNYKKTKWIQHQKIETSNDLKGYIEVSCLKKIPEMTKKPFSEEERQMIMNVSKLIGKHLKQIRKKQISNDLLLDSENTNENFKMITESITSHKLLQKFMNKSNVNRDIYHDLTPFKVKEILLIANLYDAYSIEKEGRFSEHVLGEYHQLNLTSLPRITGVSFSEEAFEQLNSKHFDLIIFMVGVDKIQTLSLSQQIKKVFPYIPIFILLNNNSDITFFEKETKHSSYIDRIFIWNGDSRIFFSMIKLVEDMINVENDTQIGMVRVILLVEDSPKYYSRYLPIFYRIVMEQTKRIIEDVSTDELYKILRMRARPKIILTSTYEGAQHIIKKYKDYLLCLITDVSFDKDNKLNKNAGFQLTKFVRNEIKNLPVIIQSSEPANEQRATQLKTIFINKNSESLLKDFQSIIHYHLGFGDFIYRDQNGSQIGIAKTLKEFEHQLKIIPDESLIYHAQRDHFSLWLMARGEIQAAKILNPRKVSEFKNPAEIRETLINVIQKFKKEPNKGKIIPFDENTLLDDSNIISLSDGSFGGKGRGIAFINTLIYNYNFKKYISDIHIKTPRTLVIGTDEFDYFLDRNYLKDVVAKEQNYDIVKRRFLQGELTEALYKKLKIILRIIKKPIAIRSSSLLEDSLLHPFAGIFETFLLPNNHSDLAVRVDQAMNAIKLVFASVYSPIARSYTKAVDYKLEEEKMAIVIQEAVGNPYKQYYYPHVSGVAQSYNYYTFAHMKPEEGFAIAAVGLGKYVVEGEKAYRFSPKYPDIEINSPKNQFLNSQTNFFAIDLGNKDLDLLEGDTAGLAYIEINEAENHGNLKHCASVYDADNNLIYPGVSRPGPRIVNFSNLLKYNYIPLAKTIETVLNVVKEALGSPVEIEFAVDLNKDEYNKASFYLLQIKPLIGNISDYNIDLEKINKEDVLMYAEKGMGNGRIKNIRDVIYVDQEKFDKNNTIQMAEEIDILNKKMCSNNTPYILIGPGRWGTRDRWIGIPVRWPQISNAKVIIEISMENFPLDASSGSHFFHNVTSMNVGYFSIQHEQTNEFINWKELNRQKVVQSTKYFKHIQFKNYLDVKMDGKKRISVITFKK